MYKSIRYETESRPYFGDETQDELRQVKKRHRKQVKALCREYSGNIDTGGHNDNCG